MNEIRIVIPDVPPSGNVLRRKYRNPHAYARLRDTWARFIWGLGPHKSRWHERRAEVSIHVESARMYDQDNLVAGCKPILDGLKKAGFIHDDSPEWIGHPVIWQTQSPNRQTTIVITEAQ